jgi:hypothetical protein
VDADTASRGMLRRMELEGIRLLGFSIPLLTQRLGLGSRTRLGECTIVSGQQQFSARQTRMRCVNECEAVRLILSEEGDGELHS